MNIATKNKAKVGIFMPCYNMGSFLEESLESLYTQTYKDFCVIIADDASTDKKSLEYLQKISRERCEIFYEKKNLGLIKIANKYMSLIDADYIMLFSPDDKMHPDFLKEQVAYLDSNPDIHAVCTWIQEFEGGNQLLKYSDKACKLPDMLVRNNFSGAALMRKSAWLEAGMHDTNPKLYPNLDYDLWLSMLQKGFKLGTISKPLFYWRVVEKSLSHNVDAVKQFTFKKALLDKYSQLYQAHALYVIEQDLIKLREFENYYAINEEGHAWLDTQYKLLSKENAELRDERDHLKRRLSQSIPAPYVKAIIRKLKHK